MKNLFLIFTLSLSSCSLFLPKPEISGEALVVIGSDYSLVNDLASTAMDGMEMAVLLHNQGYRVTVLSDNGSIAMHPGLPLPNSKLAPYYTNTFAPLGLTILAANRTNLAARLALARNNLEPGENFLFYYTGHGGVVENWLNSSGDPVAGFPGIAALEDGLLGEDDFSTSQNEFIAFCNFNSASVSQNDYVTDNWLADQAKLFPSGTQKIFIFDSCNSGGMIGQSGSVSLDGPLYGSGPILPLTWESLSPSSDMSPDKALVLAAAAERELSYGNDDATSIFNGYFTWLLLDAVSTGKGDSNNDGFVSLSEIFRYADYNLPFIFSPAYQVRLSPGPMDALVFRVE